MIFRIGFMLIQSFFVRDEYLEGPHSYDYKHQSHVRFGRFTIIINPVILTRNWLKLRTL